MLASRPFSKSSLERIEVRANWSDPVAVERLQEKGPLDLGHVWRREIDLIVRHSRRIVP